MSVLTAVVGVGGGLRSAERTARIALGCLCIIGCPWMHHARLLECQDATITS